METGGSLHLTKPCFARLVPEDCVNPLKDDLTERAIVHKVRE